jgi:hypothetical protein
VVTLLPELLLLPELPLLPEPLLPPEVVVPELPLLVEPLVPLEVLVVGCVVVVVVVVVVDPELAATAAVDDVCAASAGSWPEMRTRAIISHAATNTATAPEITRRRILRTRAARASRAACPREERGSWLLGFIVVPSFGLGVDVPWPRLNSARIRPVSGR